MSYATDVLDRIRAGDTSYDSSYTVVCNDKFFVFDDELFEDLTHEERLKYSNKSGKYPIFTIWNYTWIYLTEINEWVLIADREEPWTPDFVRFKEDYIIDVEQCQLYKKV